MKKFIFVGHQNSNYQHELFSPIMRSQLNAQYNFIFSSEKNYNSLEAKDLLKRCDLMLVEATTPTIALGIEMGWADIYGVPVICAYLKGTALSSHLKLTCDVFIEYTEHDELLERLPKIIEENIK